MPKETKYNSPHKGGEQDGKVGEMLSYWRLESDLETSYKERSTQRREEK